MWYVVCSVARPPSSQTCNHAGTSIGVSDAGHWFVFASRISDDHNVWDGISPSPSLLLLLLTGVVLPPKRQSTRALEQVRSITHHHRLSETTTTTAAVVVTSGRGTVAAPDAALLALALALAPAAGVVSSITTYASV